MAIAVRQSKTDPDNTLQVPQRFAFCVYRCSTAAAKSLGKSETAPEGHLRPGPPARTGRTPVQVWTHPEAVGQDVSILAEQREMVSTLQQP
jgi:hypothetical protein